MHLCVQELGCRRAVKGASCGWRFIRIVVTRAALTHGAAGMVHLASILWESLECDAQVDLLGPDRLQAHVFAPERSFTTQYPQVLKSIIRKSGIGYSYSSRNVINTERRVKQTVTVVGTSSWTVDSARRVRRRAHARG